MPGLTAINEFEHWYQGHLGRALLAAERLALRQSLTPCHGMVQLNVLISHRLPVASDTLIPYQCNLVPQWAEGMPDTAVVSSYTEWPVANECVDILVLHHSLDFSDSPHQTLREAQRVLRPGGRLVVVGFNPWSSWGIRKVLSRSPKGPWAGHFISPGRLRDWLCLLDFEPGERAQHFFLPPLGSFSWLSRLAFLDRLGSRLRLPTGAFYLLQASKRVPGVMPLRPQWKKRTLAGSSVIPQVVPFKPNEDC